MRQIAHGLSAALQVLTHELASWLAEDDVDFLERFVLRLRHEQDLVKPAEHGYAAVEAEGQPDAPHGGLHVGEEVGHEPGAEEERHVRRLHAVAAEVGRVDFGGEDPGQTGIRAEKALVDDQACDVEALGARGVDAVVDEVAAADKDKADEEAGKHGAGPEAPAEPLHVEDGREGAEKEGAAADKRHKDGLFGVETYLGHEGGHVVHDGVDAGELAQEDHRVGIDDGPAGARDGKEVKPRKGTCAAAGAIPFLLHGVAHDEEFFAVFCLVDAPDALPDTEGLERFALVHEEARAFGHEEHSD